jgi:hypothetical protein
MNLNNFSVSQVETHLDCPRKHALKSIFKIPDPPGDAAMRGLSIHKTLENVGERLERGVALDQALDAHVGEDAPWMNYARAIAATGVLPNPGESHAREHSFQLDTHLGIPFKGVIDLILEDRKPIDIIDYKSTSDIRYAKTPKELFTNLQLVVYAHYVFQSIPDDIVRARLVYVEAKKQPLKTKLPRTLNVAVDFNRDHVRRIWQGDLPFHSNDAPHLLPAVLERMNANADCTDFNDIAPVTTTCTKYGGCPFRNKCGLSPFAGIASANQHAPHKRITIEESKTMGFLSNNAPKTNGTNGTTAKPATIAAPATAAPTAKPNPLAPAVPGTFLARVRGEAPPAPAVPTGVTPADAPSRMTTVAQESVSTAAAADASPQAAETDSEAPKKRAGRPKKVASVETDDEQTASQPAAVAAKAGRTPFVIMINCMTVKGAGGVEPTHLDDFFATIEMELNEMAAAEENLPSYWLLQFGAQKAALAMKVQERITRGLPPVMLVNTSSNAAREVLPFLLPHATQVIQALRG